MLRILLAFAIIIIVLYNNPLLNFNHKENGEKVHTTVDEKVETVQKQVDYAKENLQRELDEVNKFND